MPTLDVLWSAEAGERHDNAIEAWGEAQARQIARLCRFFETQGMVLPFPCPAAPGEPGLIAAPD